MRAQRQRNHWFRTVSRRKASAAISHMDDEKISFKNIVCLSLISFRITMGNRENKLMRQALRPNRVFSTLSLGCISECGSMSIFTEVYQREKKKKERESVQKKNARLRQSCWLLVVKPPPGINTTAFTTYSWDWLPSRAKHFFLFYSYPRQLQACCFMTFTQAARFFDYVVRCQVLAHVLPIWCHIYVESSSNRIADNHDKFRK